MELLTPSQMRTRFDPFNPPEYKGEIKANTKRLRLLELFTRYELLPGEYIRKRANIGTRVITALNRMGVIECVPYSPEPARLDARNRPPLWAIKLKGVSLLDKPIARETDHLRHKIGRNLVQFSFDQAPHDIDGLTLRTADHILAHPNAPLTLTLDQFSFIPVGEKVIRPDSSLFGFQYERRYFYLFFEYDNGTETRKPQTERAMRKKNITKMIRLYDEALVRGTIHRTFGISNIFIAIVADTKTHMQSILEVIEEEVPPERWRNFGCKYLPIKNDATYPPPTAWTVTEDWHLAGGSTLNILDILKGVTDGRRAEARKVA